MADFYTHVTTSSVLGLAYGAGGAFLLDIPWPASCLAAGLCGVAGMLPDLDSGPGIPLRESMAFAAAVVPMLLIDRFRMLGLAPEAMVLAGAAIYTLIRFGAPELLKNYAVHRGMFHSLPALLIAGEVAFLLTSSPDLHARLFKAGGVMLGFASHLILDEIYSVDVRGMRIKSSFGTAIKIFGDNAWANFSTYAKLVVLTLLVLNDPLWVDVSPRGAEAHKLARSLLEQVWR